MDGVAKAVVGVWRAQTAPDDSDAESSPEAPKGFRKLSSSSSLNSLRISLRKRLPLHAVQTNFLQKDAGGEPTKDQPKTDAVRKLTRRARNSIGGVVQKLQRNREFSRDQCLVATPGRINEGADSASPSIQTPRRTGRSAARTGRTPSSRGKQDNGVLGVKHGGGRRQLVRMAALRSPFASPNMKNQKPKFDQDLDSVSSGLRRLKRLSKAFDELIGRDDKRFGYSQIAE
ncbi:uncharacterized protein LOC119133850 isoform X2 [Syngnathus acus]|uniref:uncharacterized protein LOC119133850 isoform X2 n=1 Tax=Syngnathus acus TaxID=161584 RepID=UPI00188601B0|nr:uncharacterized protein LOC119133850 isoform X2 [Syngnathus acus]XP_037125933.1 uncharacterized protein LOC119133850 isoform X2 [Syngnathus acus]